MKTGIEKSSTRTNIFVKKSRKAGLQNNGRSSRDSLSYLHQTLGNRAVQRLFRKKDICKNGHSEDCAKFIGNNSASCKFYECREINNECKCGDKGYYIGYGYKYCKRFNEITRFKLSSPGRRWVERTTRCLQEYLDKRVPWNTPCEKVRKMAFDSHPGCYVKSGLCSLSPIDWWHIFKTVDSSDFEMKQAIITASYCFGKWYGPPNLNPKSPAFKMWLLYHRRF